MITHFESSPSARIVRSALDEITEIQRLLSDGYWDAGDGRTLLRELMQNADDAQASRLAFVVVNEGLPDPQNPLLRHQGLMVVNDGSFLERDQRALHQALGDAKSSDPEKIGRFGVGLKSVFHVCEAFVYLGAEPGPDPRPPTLRPGALNPWAGTGPDGDRDPLHPDWDTLEPRDAQVLLEAARAILGSFARGLLLWIPLRHREHLNRAQEGEQDGLGTDLVHPNDVVAWFKHPDSLALVLAQCGHLCCVEAFRAATIPELDRRTALVRVGRPGFKSCSWVGRYRDDDVRPTRTRPFKGTIYAGDQDWSVAGVDAVGHERLRETRVARDWPIDRPYIDGRRDRVPRKALAHAAITVLHRRESATGGVRLRWAVFLPLEDDAKPKPGSGPLVETVECPTSPGWWDIVMHGYFWPSHNRRSIPGVTDNRPDGSKESRVRAEWNRGIRDDLMLPLLPQALECAVRDVPQDAACRLLGAVARTKIIRKHNAAITKNHVLLPVIAECGIRWNTHRTDEARVVVIPWKDAPSIVRQNFVRQIEEAAGIICIDANAPKIGGTPRAWPAKWLRVLLSCVSVEILRTPQELAWVEQCIGCTLERHDDEDDARRKSVADWLAERIGEGAMTACFHSPPDTRKDLRKTWRRVYEHLPKEWLIHAPVESQRAVVELADAKAVGAGLLPIPFGTPGEPDVAPRPDPERLDGALLALGNLLRREGSQSAHDARLILADTLLAIRDDRPFGDRLAQLPMIRALRLPEGRYDAWSDSDLRQQAAEHRVFARGDEPPSAQVDAGSGDGVDPAGGLPGRAGRAARQPRQAVKELADAAGIHFWLVRSMAVTARAAPVSKEALASALLHAKAISKDPELRKPLLRALAAGTVSRLVGRAMSVLLTGTMAGGSEECDIYHVRSQDTQRDTNRRTLDILLGLRRQSWRVAGPQLVHAVPRPLYDSLRIKEIDPGVLQVLLRETLAESSNDAWHRLPEPDMLHLLKHLYRTEEADRALWRAMPLHRRTGGARGPLDDQTARATGGGRLPLKLKTKVTLLEPDDGVTELYLDVPQLDDDGVLRLMLEDEHPQQFVSDIVDRLRPDRDQVILPRDRKLRDLLKNSQWLSGRDKGLGIAPGRILCLPPKLSALIAPLSEALGKHWLSSQVDPDCWSVAKDVVHEIIGRQGPGRQVERLADALNTNAVARIDSGAYLLLSRADDVDQELIADALKSPLESHLGWEIVRTVAEFVRTTGGNVPRAVSRLARAFCAPVPSDRQLSTLQHIAKSSPGKDAPPGRLFRRLVETYAKDDGFFKCVLPHIKLPTQNGWWPTSEIAQSSFGVAKRHRILQDLRRPLRLDYGESIGKEVSGDTTIRSGKASDYVFAKYFKPWAGRLNPGAVGALLSLFGNGNDGAMRRLAQCWLGEVDVAEARRDLTGVGEKPFSNVPVFVLGSKEDGWVKAVNILGKAKMMEADPDNDTIFATAPRWDTARFWNVALRHVDPSGRSAPELTKLLGKTAHWWAVKYMKIDRPRVQKWWARWGTGSQAQVEPVRALILANLPLTLRRLDVRECPELQDAVTRAERAQIRREQTAEKKALGRLESLIDKHSDFLRERVRNRMEESGYTVDSTLLELVQNADDALAQARDIAGGKLSVDARRVVVRVNDEHIGQPTVDIKHFGRPINDTGDAEFSARQDRQWDLDLYFMMLMDLTAKTGEASGARATASTTGCFGLGFKSVHLVSDAPSVVSGYIAFSIAGGLLPKEEQVPDDTDLNSVDGQQVTRIRLPLRSDDDLITRMFCRFRHARSLLPAFAREIGEIVVEGGPDSGVSVFHGEPVAGAPGWSVARTPTKLSNGDSLHILRFRPGAETDTEALVLGLRNGLPTPFPSDVPFLWNVAPTSERWGCGYAVNGPFKLDHGRINVALEHENTRRVARQLGEALGKGLVELHEALANDAGPACGLPGRDDVALFTASLWNVLSSGIDTEDPRRRQFLGWLHDPGRGVSAWMFARSVVPSELPAPFGKQLPPLSSDMRIEDMRIEFAEDGDLWRVVAGIKDLVQLARNHLVVSNAVAERLRLLLPRIKIDPLQPMDLFSELAESWNHRLTPERLCTLRQLEPEHIWKLIGTEWPTNLVARPVAGEFVPLRELLLPLGSETADDESKRAAFAPDAHVLDSKYVTEREDAVVFRRLRMRLQIDSATMASWFTDIADSKRRAALHYLLHGSLQTEILARLVPSETRPPWLNDRSDVSCMISGLSDTWRCDALLSALFPHHGRSALDTSGDAPDADFAPAPPSPPEDFFERLQRWWDCSSIRQAVLDHHETETWPAWLRRDRIGRRLRDNSRDHWLALLVLGAFQRLGRSQPMQHRGFLETANDKGWWEVFRRPNEPSNWMEVLRSWHDSAVDHLEYSNWMSLFPTIYLLSRYLSKYRDLLRTADRRQNLDDLTRLLAPRSDSAMSGAGRNFDAPPAPLNMGLHWILRELVRLRVLDPCQTLLPYCWVPSDQVLRFLYRLGLPPPESNASNSDKARTVYDFLKSRLRTPHLHYAFDIPLRYVADNKDVQRELGLSD